MTGTGTLRYHLETIRRFQPHTLSERKEKIVNSKNITVVAQSFAVRRRDKTPFVHAHRQRQTEDDEREEMTSYPPGKDDCVKPPIESCIASTADQHDLLGENTKPWSTKESGESPLRRFSLRLPPQPRE